MQAAVSHPASGEGGPWELERREAPPSIIMDDDNSQFLDVDALGDGQDDVSDSAQNNASSSSIRRAVSPRPNPILQSYTHLTCFSAV